MTAPHIVALLTAYHEADHAAFNTYLADLTDDDVRALCVALLAQLYEAYALRFWMDLEHDDISQLIRQMAVRAAQ